MKSVGSFLLTSVLLLTNIASGWSAELKVRGDWRVNAMWTGNNDFIDEERSGNVIMNNFNVFQRARVWFDFIANEHLKAVLGIQIGSITWGSGTGLGPYSGGAIGSDGVNIRTKHAYLNFNIPDTKISMTTGLLPLTLPNNLGSAILDDDLAAAVLNIPVNDNLNITFSYARALNGDNTDPLSARRHDEYDLAALIVPLNFKGISISPFFVLGWLGIDSGYPAQTDSGVKTYNPWWIGLSVNVSVMNPWVFMFDFNYAHQSDKAGSNGVKINSQQGWFMDLAIDYKLSFMTPEFFFIYASGDDGDTENGSERMPTISPDYMATSFFFDASQFSGAEGSIRQKSNPWNINNNGDVVPTGLWALGLALKNITYFKELRHTIRVMYAQGTNSRAGAGIYYNIRNKQMSTADNLLEVNFDSAYRLYDGLDAIAEMSYCRLSVSEDVWGTAVKTSIKPDTWKIGLGFRYRF